MLDYVAVYEDQFGDKRALEIKYSECSDALKIAKASTTFNEGLLLFITKDEYENLVKEKDLPRLI